MHLVELLSLRSVPAAGLALGLTRRCPLTCAHCSTNSTLSSEQLPDEVFIRFVDTFDADSHLEILAMSGGEAMLRPKLVRNLAERARKVGTRSTVLSGMFFACSERVPLAIKEAIKAVDHFSVSLDMFHEREVPRIKVFRVLDALLCDGIDISIHMVGQDATDPYVESTVKEVQRVFDGRVPMLVNSLSFFGRAKSWLTRNGSIRTESVDANPCAMAAWPVVGFDGTIVACGNDNVLDDVPAHLRLGHINSDNWATIRARTLTSSTLRAIRLFGPEYIVERFGNSGIGCDGYCQTCTKLSDESAYEKHIDEVMAKPSIAVVEEHVSAMQRHAGALAFARRYGIPRYANLVALGAPT